MQNRNWSVEKERKENKWKSLKTLWKNVNITVFLLLFFFVYFTLNCYFYFFFCFFPSSIYYYFHKWNRIFFSCLLYYRRLCLCYSIIFFNFSGSEPIALDNHYLIFAASTGSINKISFKQSFFLRQASAIPVNFFLSLNI